MKLFIMQFSPTSCHFIPLMSKYSQHPALRHTHCSSLNVRDQVSHTYRTTGKLIILYILIFMFLDSSISDTKYGISCFFFVYSHGMAGLCWYGIIFCFLWLYSGTLIIGESIDRRYHWRTTGISFFNFLVRLIVAVCRVMCFASLILSPYQVSGVFIVSHLDQFRYFVC
jgi:hypothetical protein